jgi:hypothetical protein
MNLTDTQKQQVASWIAAGLKLAEIQKRLESEFGLRPTYMEVKLLVGDLQLVPKDPDPPAPAPASALTAPAGTTPPAATPGKAAPATPAAGTGQVSVTTDQIARPGTMVSGSVTFSDGKGGAWYIDQSGRLGLSPREKGYRPNAVDMQEFQMLLEQEMSRLGF